MSNGLAQLIADKYGGVVTFTQPHYTASLLTVQFSNSDMKFSSLSGIVLLHRVQKHPFSLTVAYKVGTEPLVSVKLLVGGSLRMDQLPKQRAN